MALYWFFSKSDEEAKDKFKSHVSSIKNNKILSGPACLSGFKAPEESNAYLILQTYLNFDLRFINNILKEVVEVSILKKTSLRYMVKVPSHYVGNGNYLGYAKRDTKGYGHSETDESVFSKRRFYLLKISPILNKHRENLLYLVYTFLRMFSVDEYVDHYWGHDTVLKYVYENTKTAFKNETLFKKYIEGLCEVLTPYNHCFYNQPLKVELKELFKVDVWESVTEFPNYPAQSPIIRTLLAQKKIGEPK
jgi:hypothetical protein